LIEAKKRFGQNFLKDEAVLEKIIQSMPKNDNVIVEIGPGLGDLTKKLLEIKDVIAFEIDRELCAYLEERFKDEIKSGRLKLVCGDVLEQWERNLVQRDYDLVANLPYYVATNIVLKALQDDRCKNILVMLQKEVADKFGAKEGNREFSSLSVLAQSSGDVERVAVVKPESFSPPPKVDSAVLLINKKRNLEDGGFFDFLKTAFKQPRKTLMKNLSQVFDKELLSSLFSRLNLASSVRPHQASTSIYHQIFKEVKEKIDGEQPKQSEQSTKESADPAKPTKTTS